MKKSVISTVGTSLIFLKKIALFAGFSDEDIMYFANAAEVKNYKKGKNLYRESEQADFFYFICSGWIKLFHITEEGEEINLAILTKDNITGENAVFENGLFSCSAQVVEDVEILRIPHTLLKAHIRTNNQLAFNMLTSMVNYQRQHDLQLEQYLLYSAPQRIGCFLLGLCPVKEQKDGVKLALPYDKTLIASVLGMKGATFSRALNILRTETGVQIRGTRVTVESMKRLLSFVDGCYSQTQFHKFIK